MILWTKRRSGGIFCIGVEWHGRPCFWQCTHCNNTYCCIFLILIGQFRKSSSFFRGERRRQPPPLARSSDRSSLSACELQEKLFELNYTIDMSITHLLHTVLAAKIHRAVYCGFSGRRQMCVDVSLHAFMLSKKKISRILFLYFSIFCKKLEQLRKPILLTTFTNIVKLCLACLILCFVYWNN